MQLYRSLMFLAALVAATIPASADDWEVLFDGKTLTGWDGDPNTWSVKDGAITGQTYNEEDKKLKGNTFIIWRGGEVDNFELELEYKIVNGTLVFNIEASKCRTKSGSSVATKLTLKLATRTQDSLR